MRWLHGFDRVDHGRSVKVDAQSSHVPTRTLALDLRVGLIGCRWLVAAGIPARANACHNVTVLARRSDGTRAGKLIGNPSHQPELLRHRQRPNELIISSSTVIDIVWPPMRIIAIVPRYVNQSSCRGLAISRREVPTTIPLPPQPPAGRQEPGPLRRTNCVSPRPQRVAG